MEWIALIVILLIAYLAATGRLDNVWTTITTGTS